MEPVITALGLALFVFIVFLVGNARERTDPREQGARRPAPRALPAPPPSVCAPPFRPNEALIDRGGAMPSASGTGPSGLGGRAPLGELHDALLKHMLDELAGVPVAQRRRARWVMNPEWLEEVRAMARALGEAPASLTEEATLFGKPVETRADGGVPHLEVVASP